MLHCFQACPYIEFHFASSRRMMAVSNLAHSIHGYEIRRALLPKPAMSICTKDYPVDICRTFLEPNLREAFIFVYHCKKPF